MPPGILTSITELGGKTKILSGGSSCWAVRAPLRIWRRTGTVGGRKPVLPLMVKTRSVTLNPMSILIATSGGPDPPGAPGFSSGCKFVSCSRLDNVEVVLGSATGAPL